MLTPGSFRELGTGERLTEIIPPNAANAVAYARQLARQIDAADKRKVDRLYRRLKAIERDPEVLGKKKGEPLPDTIKADLYFLVPLTADIDPSVRARLEEGLELIYSVEDFHYLIRFFEAVVAYTK